MQVHLYKHGGPQLVYKCREGVGPFHLLLPLPCSLLAALLYQLHVWLQHHLILCTGVCCGIIRPSGHCDDASCVYTRHSHGRVRLTIHTSAPAYLSSYRLLLVRAKRAVTVPSNRTPLMSQISRREFEQMDHQACQLGGDHLTLDQFDKQRNSWRQKVFIHNTWYSL